MIYTVVEAWFDLHYVHIKQYFALIS